MIDKMSMRPPKTLCEGYVWASLVNRRDKANPVDGPLPRVYLRAYQRADRKPYVLVNQAKNSHEVLYMLELEGLRSIERQARDDTVTYFFTFGIRYKIKTSSAVNVKQKARRLVIVCKPEDAKMWDMMLATEPDKAKRRKRKKIKDKMHSVVTNSRALFTRNKAIPNYLCESEEESEADSEQCRRRIDDGKIARSTPLTPESPTSPSSRAPSSRESDLFGSTDMGDDDPIRANIPRRLGRKELIAGKRDDSNNRSQSTPSSHLVNSVLLFKREMTISGEIREKQVINFQNSENDFETVASESSSKSLEEMCQELKSRDDESPSKDVTPSRQVDHPFKTFDQLIATPEHIRYKTKPHPIEFDILLDFEAQVDSGKMLENGWELGFQQTKGIKCTLYRKELPATVSSAILLSGHFCEIDAPPELVFYLIYDNKERLSWDDNIKSIDLIEPSDEHNREIEYTVMKSPIGFSNREFLKYRMTRANYKQYPYMMLLRSMSRDDCPIGKFNVRAESVFNGYVIRPDPDDPQKTRVTIAANTDIKGLIPTWTVNALSARLPPRWVASLESACKSYMKKHQISRDEANLSKYLPKQLP